MVGVVLLVARGIVFPIAVVYIQPLFLHPIWPPLPPLAPLLPSPCCLAGSAVLVNIPLVQAIQGSNYAAVDIALGLLCLLTLAFPVWLGRQQLKEPAASAATS